MSQSELDRLRNALRLAGSPLGALFDSFGAPDVDEQRPPSDDAAASER